ncbi:MAG: excinuclease ABC subunit UvrA [Patescibacteria group bacterium]|nr:excinuclease ABC subunit UvrA [Patescibacteria group bacterium]
MSKNYISIKGARVHNLKNIDVKIPRDKFTVITGLSGSGKSSLAFDTIFAEGQRRYMESLSSYARQFLAPIQKPDVDYIEGLSPAIAIDQKSAAQSPRSTVGTMSEIYDYFRLLFTRIGKPYCPNCNTLLNKQQIITKNSPDRIKKGAAKTISENIYFCPKCNIRLNEFNISSFSFNSPNGACPVCQGLGKRKVIEPEMIFPNMRLTLAEGAIRPWSRTTSHASWYQKSLKDLSAKYKFSLNTPVGHLSKTIRQIILYGTGDGFFEGVIPNLERRFAETDSEYIRLEIEKYMVQKICSSCNGERLRKEVLQVKIAGKNIVDLSKMNISEARDLFNGLKNKISELDYKIAQQIIKEVIERLGFLIDVGLAYLTLDRSADTLAGGEAQRIRLATQLGSYLTGVIYILDEPSIGLHERDQEKLIKTLNKLKVLGNTVIVVEHDRQTMLSADHLIDVGPGAGEFGGKIVAQGTPDQVKNNSKSITGQYLKGTKEIELPKTRRGKFNKFLTVKGASEFNLKNIDVKIPANSFTCVTGVSGSGKSTLIVDILAKALVKKIHHAKQEPGAHKAIIGANLFNKVIDIDQSPIGRTPRSNPATYTNIFSPIREIYTNLPEAKKRHYNSGHFSFNVKGGRCETCRGEGMIKFEMHFLPDVYVTCETCNGRRYNKEVLDILYKGKNISDVLEMTVDEALDFFKDVSILKTKLSVLSSVGLGYMKLGQSATTLSGGEAQRVKLAAELARQDTGKTLYILDEPTTGLHFEDIKKLLGVLQALVDKGNTVLVIEHNLDVIKCADWVIDLGPEGGAGGGEIVAQGAPEVIAKNNRSHTGAYLKKLL